MEMKLNKIVGIMEMSVTSVAKCEWNTNHMILKSFGKNLFHTRFSIIVGGLSDQHLNYYYIDLNNQKNPST